MSNRALRIQVCTWSRRDRRYVNITPLDRTCTRPALVIQHEGRDWYFIGADLSRRTATYADVRPEPVTR